LQCSFCQLILFNFGYFWFKSIFWTIEFVRYRCLATMYPQIYLTFPLAVSVMSLSNCLFEHVWEKSCSGRFSAALFVISFLKKTLYHNLTEKWHQHEHTLALNSLLKIYIHQMLDVTERLWKMQSVTFVFYCLSFIERFQKMKVLCCTKLLKLFYCYQVNIEWNHCKKVWFSLKGSWNFNDIGFS
jgi:hypothetical protein